MKKILLLIICLFCLTGCTLNYEINFGYTMIEEHINATMDGNIYEIASSIDGDGFYLEKEIVEGNIPSIKGFKDFYTRKIKVKNNSSVVDLDYIYKYDEYENSYLLTRCFEKTYVKNTDDYLYVSLGGNFKCFKEDDIQIKVSSMYDVVKHNANKVEDNYYIWDIKLADDENKVEFYISKEITEKENNKVSGWKIVIIILFGIIGLFIFINKRKIK